MNRPAALAAMLTLICPPMAMADVARGGGPLLPRPLEIGTLEQLRWQVRPVVVLGEGSAVEAQIAALQDAADALRERDVVLLTDGPGAEALRGTVGPGFAVLLIGKDGGIKLDRRSPVDPAEIVALIDDMPMRRREAGDG